MKSKNNYSKKNKKDPLVSIVVLSWNTLDETRACINNIAMLDYQNTELIVVDNGSSDGSKKYLGSLTGIVYVDLPKNTGFTGGQNAALKVSKGKYLALVNSDAVLDKKWLTVLVDELESNQNIAAAGGRAYIWNDTNPAFNTNNQFYSYQVVDPRRGYARTLQTGSEKLFVQSISGAAVLIRRSAVDAVGYFDDRFFAYYEETDLFARIQRKGFLIAYHPDAHVWHKIAQSTKSYPWFYLYQMHRNRALFALKNFDTYQAWRFWFLYTYDTGKALVKYIRGRDIDNKARLKAWFWNAIKLFPTIVSRRTIQKLGDTYSRLLDVVPRGKAVTVIIPCYNYADHVSEAIDSVLRQTHKVSRVIVIDDGSTDNSLEVARSYKQQGVEVIAKKNEGVIATKNLGISEASSDWTIFLDADDVLEGDYVETLLRCAEKSGADVVYTDAQYFGASNKLMKGRPFSFRSLLRGNYIHNSALIGTDFLKMVGGYKPQMQGGYEDWELYITLAEAGAKFDYTTSVRLRYRQHNGANSRNREAKRKAHELERRVKQLHRKSYLLRFNPLTQAFEYVLLIKRHPLLPAVLSLSLAKSTIKGTFIFLRYVKHETIARASKYMNRNISG